MTNKEILKKQIIYRSTHRGTKEMDLLLGNFVRKNIDLLNDNELNELDSLLSIDDESLYKWYINQKSLVTIPVNKVSNLLKKYKIK